MKGVLVSFGVVLLTSLLIFYSGLSSDAKRSNSFSVESAEINFENTGGTYVGYYDEEEKTYSWKPAESAAKGTLPDEAFYFRKLSPVDGVYTESDGSGSISVTESGSGSVRVKVGTGRYVFALQDPYRSYEISSDTVTIKPFGAGTFFLDNRPDRHAVYSFSALLDIALPLDAKTAATKFTLFPTLLFEYEPSYTRSLRGADMLRIATVDSIRSLDARKEEDLAVIAEFKAVDPDTDRLVDDRESRDEDPTTLLSLSMEDISERSKKYSEIFSDLLGFETRSVDGSEFIDRYPSLFINPAKKDVYNRRELLEKLVDLFSRDYRTDDKGVTESENAILALLQKIHTEDPESYERARSMIRVSSYLWIATRMLHRESDLPAHVAEKHRFGAFLAKVFPEDKIATEYHGTISDIYASYFFGPLIEKNVHKFLNDYLADTVENKRIEQSDFLYFGYFLISYLQAFDDAFSKDAFDIAYSLIRIMDEYYLSSAPDMAASARASLLSTVFYNYHVVLDHLVTRFRDEVFTQDGEHLLLRDEWVSGSKSAIPDSVVKSLASLADMLSSKEGNMVYLEDKEASVSTLLAFRGTNLSTNRDKLFRSLTETKRLVEIINTYPTYLQNIQLSDDLGRTGIDLSEPKVLDAKELREYLSQFNGLDTERVEIKNLATMQKDGYFQVHVPIKGHLFDFKLDPNGHTIYETVYATSTGAVVDMYKGYVVNLDDKKEQMDKVLGSQRTDRQKFLFDFKNVFENMFFYTKEIGDVPLQGVQLASQMSEEEQKAASAGTGADDGMSAETKVFVERELMRKDFKYIADTMQIGFNDVYVQIVRGKYDVTIRPLRTGVSGRQGHPVDFSAKYDFTSHSFTDIEIKVYENGAVEGLPRFGGHSIRVANPQSIFIKSFKERFLELGFYVEAADSVAAGSGVHGDMTVDFVNKTITIDGRTIPVDTSNIQ